MEKLLLSLGLNIILLFCLFSPNVVYFIHSKWFNWKDDMKVKSKKIDKNLSEEQQWWNKLGSFSKLTIARRHYPATNWEFVTKEIIIDMYNKEKIKN